MSHNSDRREFISRSAMAIGTSLATPYYFISRPSWAANTTEPSDRVVFGAIGTGDRWGSFRSNDQLKGVGGNALKFGDFVAVCDVDASRKERAFKLTGGKADQYEDYRHVLDRDDIQAVTIVTPDHWHTKIAIDAMRAGKDVYCEKPLTLTIDEGKQICRVVKETNRVFQVGTQQRSEFGARFLKAVAIAKAGRLGEIKRVTVAIGPGQSSGSIPVVAMPPYLNWDKWLGPAPMTSYRYRATRGQFGESRCHYQFRWWYEYSGGKLTDWGAHHIDIAQWAIGMDHSGPASIEPLEVSFPVEMKDGFPLEEDQYNTPTSFKLRCLYPNGVEMLIRNEADDLGFGNGIMIEGDKGKILVNRNKLVGKAVDDLKADPLPEDAITELCKGMQPGNHMGNFVECMKTRTEPISDVFTHHRCMTTCHLANIALRLDRTLSWDPLSEQIIGDDLANSFLSRQPRNGYELDA